MHRQAVGGEGGGKDSAEIEMISTERTENI